MNVEFKQFTEDMIPEAGSLLALRHRANRQLLPLMPQRFEDPHAGARAVKSLWDNKSRQGYAAFSNGRMIAYLLGEIVKQEWGRCGYVQLPGYALIEGEGPGLIQDLYGMIGDSWVRQGAFNHYFFVSAADRAIIESLFDIGLGKEGVRALLSLDDLSIPDVEPPAGITVRRARPGDNEFLAGMSDTIYRALAEAPYWFPVHPETWGELREGWAELADEKEWMVWMALDDATPLGTIGFHPEQEEDDNLLISPKTVDLTIAATKPQARGRGINTCLSWTGLKGVRDAGFRICHISWVSANLWAARHWHRYGFVDVAYRLGRKINPDIAWTRP